MTLVESFTPQQVEAFDRDGDLVVAEGLVSDRALESFFPVLGDESEYRTPRLATLPTI